MESISLGEKVFILSEAGQKPLEKIDFKEQDFSEATRIYEKLKENEGKIDFEELEKPLEIPVAVTGENIRRGFRKMPKDKRQDILRMSLKAKDIKIKQKIKARENRKSDITPVANLSKKSWQKLPKNGREAILQKVCSLQNELVRE
ncbi:hypothetical protein ES702_07027 [subsurface metagenome]